MQHFDHRRLRKAREDAGLSREEASLKARRSHASIVAYELGRVSPPLPVLETLAEVFGVEPAALFSDREPVA